MIPIGRLLRAPDEPQHEVREPIGLLLGLLSGCPALEQVVAVQHDVPGLVQKCPKRLTITGAGRGEDVGPHDEADRAVPRGSHERAAMGG